MEAHCKDIISILQQKLVPPSVTLDVVEMKITLQLWHSATTFAIQRVRQRKISEAIISSSERNYVHNCYNL